MTKYQLLVLKLLVAILNMVHRGSAHANAAFANEALHEAREAIRDAEVLKRCERYS